MARPRGSKFQADVTINGKRRRITFDTLQGAMAYEAAASKGLPLITSLSFQRFHQENFEYLWGGSKAPEATRYNLAALDKLIPAWTSIVDIDTAFILQITARMKKSGSSNATINRRLSALSKLLRHAERLAVMKRPHIDFLKEPHGRERVLSVREEQKMNRYFRHHGLHHAWAVSFFLLYTGCRLGEVFTLRRDRVSDGRVSFHYTVTKTTRTRLVPLVGPAKDAWDFVCAASGDETPFGVYPRDTFRNHWTRLRGHLGALDDDEFVPHMLRHTCASRLVSKGIPLPKVMLWMGHTSIQTTLRYSHLAPHDLDDAAAALWPNTTTRSEDQTV
ncbi:MAG TPA: hypothetical protein DIC56_09865 [Rhizobium sp.]|nr:hypothetical protein [Rhizobium sp.]